MKFHKFASIQSIRQAALAGICALIIYGCSGSSDPGTVEMGIGSESSLETVDGDTLSSNDDSNVADADSATDLSVGDTDSHSSEASVSPVVTGDGEVSNDLPITTDLEPVTELPIEADNQSNGQITSPTEDGSPVDESMISQNDDQTTSDGAAISPDSETTSVEAPTVDAAGDDTAMDEPATVPEDSVTPIDARTILPELAEELLASIIESVTLSNFAMEVDLVNAIHPDGAFSPESVSTEPGLTVRDIVGNTGTFDCANGGSYTYRASTSGSGGGTGNFDNCSLENVFGGGIVNGEYFRSQQYVAGAVESAASTLTLFRNLTSLDPSGRQRSLSGRMDFSRRTVNDSIPVIAGFGESMTGVEFTSSGDSDGDVTSMTGSFLLFRVIDTEDPSARLDRPRTYEIYSTYSSPRTGGSEFSVRTTAPFSTIDPRSIAEDGCYVSGLLEVIAEDGSAMIMRVDNGDPATFQLDVNALNGSTSLTIPWDERFEPLRFPLNASGEVNHAECTRG